MSHDSRLQRLYRFLEIGTRVGSHPLAVSLSAAVLLLLVPALALATPGALDPSFDGDGRVTTDFGSPEEQTNAIAVQPDGKLLVIAQTTDQDTFVTTYVLLRYDTTGSMDPTFDGDGILVLGGIGPKAVTVQSDGKIIVAGTWMDDFAVARLNDDGSADTTFSGDGFATADFGGGQDIGLDVALQDDGKIVVVGSTAPDFDARDFAVARFNDDGTLDTSFSGDGIQHTSVHGINEEANAVAIQADGKIVLAGTTDGRDFDSLDFGLVRYLPDGTRDPSFSTDGKLRTNFGLADRAFDVSLQADGKIVVGGTTCTCGSTNYDFALARYKLNGTLDTTFSGDGKLRTDFSKGNDEARAVLIQANGRIVLAGFAAPARDADASEFALARFRTSGRLDLSFSGDGKQRTQFGTSHQDYGFDAVLQADGRIVLTGAVAPLVNGYDVGLARYLAS